jgi:hypothetical protein
LAVCKCWVRVRVEEVVGQVEEKMAMLRPEIFPAAADLRCLGQVEEEMAMLRREVFQVGEKLLVRCTAVVHQNARRLHTAWTP